MGCSDWIIPACVRLEKAIANLKPMATEPDPTINFWTAYKKVADEHDDNMVPKYVGNLDTSLLFVSVFTTLVCLILLSPLVFLH